MTHLPVWRVALLCMLWLGATAWLRPLSLPDEGRYVGVAFEMVRSGEWLTPTLNGLPYFHKPPLFYWLSAASLQLFGEHEWAARLAPMLGATGGALALYLFMARWASRRAANVTLLALMAQPLWTVGGQFANLDMLVAGCITATVLLGAHAVLCVEQGLPHRRVVLAAYTLAALGVLAKGLIGFVLPALVLMCWLVASGALRDGRIRPVWRALCWSPALALFLLLVLPWFVLMELRFPGFTHYFFVVQHLHRFVGGGFNNVQPFWYYPAVLLLFGWPWLPWAAAWRNRAFWTAEPTRRLCLLMASWCAVVLLFFSAPQSKLLGYILPAVPALVSLLALAYLSNATPTRTMARLWSGAAVLGGVLSVVAMVALSLHAPKSARPLALVLAPQLAQQLATHTRPTEPVFMLEHYYFDLPFYAHAQRPVVVVDHWDDPARSRDDSWRKELADAARFAPTRAAQVLLTPAQMAWRLCQTPGAWLVGGTSSAGQYPFLAQANTLASTARATLWHLNTSAPAVIKALGCAGMPNDGWPSK